MRATDIIAALHANCVATPQYPAWRHALDAGAFAVRVADADNVVAQAGIVVEEAADVVPCGCCGRDITTCPDIGWLELDYGPTLDCHGWERLCAICYFDLLSDTKAEGWPDHLWPKVLQAIQVTPGLRRGYSNPPSAPVLAALAQPARQGRGEQT